MVLLVLLVLVLVLRLLLVLLVLLLLLLLSLLLKLPALLIPPVLLILPELLDLPVVLALPLFLVLLRVGPPLLSVGVQDIIEVAFLSIIQHQTRKSRRLAQPAIPLEPAIPQALANLGPVELVLLDPAARPLPVSDKVLVRRQRGDDRRQREGQAARRLRHDVLAPGEPFGESQLLSGVGAIGNLVYRSRRRRRVILRARLDAPCEQQADAGEEQHSTAQGEGKQPSQTQGMPRRFCPPTKL